jgi:hypothetical protein
VPVASPELVALETVVGDKQERSVELVRGPGVRAPDRVDVLAAKSPLSPESLRNYGTGGIQRGMTQVRSRYHGNRCVSHRCQPSAYGYRLFASASLAPSFRAASVK